MEKPKTQLSEVLHYLIRKGSATRLQLMAELYVMNAPEVVRKLRERGVAIVTVNTPRKNKFGRKCDYGIYILKDIDDAILIYKKIQDEV